jgi:phosphoglycerate kinase
VPKQSIRDLELNGRKVLVRVDFNVPRTSDGGVSDDRRINSALPTLDHVLQHGGSLILISHLGRPIGDLAADKPFRMDPVAQRLQELIRRPVKKTNDTVGPEAQAACAALQPGEIVLLENVRFNKGEKVPKIDPATGVYDEKSLAMHQEFAKRLAALGEVYVNDAFGTCHRDEASMVAVPKLFPVDRRAIGFLVEKELKALETLLANPKTPLVAILGGAKVSSKFALIESLLPRVDKMLVGGAMTYTFLLAEGKKTGNSLVEPDWVEKARDLKTRAGGKLELPRDTVIATKADDESPTQTIKSGTDIPDGWEGFDIGPETRLLFAEIIAKAGTVVWNGPMGKFEVSRFAAGTKAVAEALAKSRAVTVVGGGETAEAIEAFGLADQVDHVSTGGGAFLESLEGKQFNSLQVIPDR